MIKIKEKNNISKIKVILRQLLETSSSHGIPNAIRSKHLSLKIMWVIFFLVSTGFCAYFILLSFIEYFEYNVITKVRIINEIPTDFAEIKICNFNPYTTDYSYRMLLKISEENNLRNFLDNLTEFNTLKIKAIYYFASSNFSNADRKKLGYSLKEMLISCRFNNKDCNENDFEWTFNAYYGNCFSFNSNKNYSTISKSMIDGSFNGFNLVLYIGMHEDLKKFHEYFGVRIFVSNSSFKSMFQNEIVASTGAENYITLQRTFVNQLPHPYSNCMVQSNVQDPNSFKSGIYKRLVQSNFSYNYRDCSIMCYQLSVEKHCKCYDYLFPSINSRLSCNLSDPCLTNQANFYNNQSKETTECIQTCPIECNKRVFTYTMSQVNSMSEEYAQYYLNHELIKSKFANRKPTFNDIKNGLVSLKIYYDSLSYTEINESPSITEISLISNIGGTLGLFIGISLLSIIEIFEILFEILFVVFKD